MVNKLLDDMNKQIRENTALLGQNIKNQEQLKQKLVEDVSKEIYKDIKRRV